MPLPLLLPLLLPHLVLLLLMLLLRLESKAMIDIHRVGAYRGLVGSLGRRVLLLE